jgi:hypothetical protein
MRAIDRDSGAPAGCRVSGADSGSIATIAPLVTAPQNVRSTVSGRRRPDEEPKNFCPFGLSPSGKAEAKTAKKEGPSFARK